MTTALDVARNDPGSQKALLLRAARRVFAERGFHAASTRAIAKEGGVDVSTLYYHWGNKQNLFDAVLQDVQAELEQVLRVWLVGSKGQAPRDALDRGLELLLPWAFDNQDAVRIVLFSMIDYELEGSSWDVNAMPQLLGTLREFARRRLGIERLPEHFDMLAMSLIGALLLVVGARRYHAAVLDEGAAPDALLQPTAGALRALVDVFFVPRGK